MITKVCVVGRKNFEDNELIDALKVIFESVLFYYRAMITFYSMQHDLNFDNLTFAAVGR